LKTPKENHQRGKPLFQPRLEPANTEIQIRGVSEISVQRQRKAMKGEPVDPLDTMDYQGTLGQ
jgi:hypothetical protein